MSSETLNGIFAVGGALGGAALGALIAGWFTWKAAIAQAGRKILICNIGRTNNIINQISVLSIPIEISYSGTKIDALQRVDLSFSNVGNRAIQNVIAHVTLSDHRPAFQLIPSDPKILETGTVRLVRKIGPEFNKSLMVVEIDYINPKEIFEFAAYYEGSEQKIDVASRGVDVEFRQVIQSEVNVLPLELILDITNGLPGAGLMGIVLRAAMTKTSQNSRR